MLRNAEVVHGREPWESLSFRAGSSQPPPAPGGREPALNRALRDLARSGEARRLRLAAGISGKTMAAGLGISRGHLANIEAARRVPPAGSALAARYARVLRGLANHGRVSRELAAQERHLAG